jgi:hypothetical protein
MPLKLGFKRAPAATAAIAAVDAEPVPVSATHERPAAPTTPIPPRPPGRAPSGAATLPARLLGSMPAPWVFECVHETGIRFTITTHGETYRRQLALGRRVLHGVDWVRATVAAERGRAVLALEDYLTGVQPFEWALGDVASEPPLNTPISVAAVLDHFRARLVHDNPNTEATL